MLLGAERQLRHDSVEATTASNWRTATTGRWRPLLWPKQLVATVGCHAPVLVQSIRSRALERTLGHNGTKYN